MAANLTAAEGCTHTPDDACALLATNDFIPLPGGLWLCEEIRLGMLDQLEIISIDSVD